MAFSLPFEIFIHVHIVFWSYPTPTTSIQLPLDLSSYLPPNFILPFKNIVINSPLSSISADHFVFCVVCRTVSRGADWVTRRGLPHDRFHDMCVPPLKSQEWCHCAVISTPRAWLSRGRTVLLSTGCESAQWPPNPAWKAAGQARHGKEGSDIIGVGCTLQPPPSRAGLLTAIYVSCR